MIVPTNGIRAKVFANTRVTGAWTARRAWTILGAGTISEGRIPRCRRRLSVIRWTRCWTRCALRRRRELDRQRLQLVDECRLGHRGRAGELHLGVARERFLEQHLQLEPGQRRAQTEVPAARAEG